MIGVFGRCVMCCTRQNVASTSSSSWNWWTVVWTTAVCLLCPACAYFTVGALLCSIFAYVDHKVIVLAYRCLIGTAPSYIAETLHLTADVGSRRRLQSASTSTLVVPSTRRTTLGDRAFPVTAARAWNALPSSVRSAPLLLQFRRDQWRDDGVAAASSDWW